jgi:replicative DNA helicase
LDDVTVFFYLEKHSKLKEQFNEYGGYDKISSTFEYVNIENLDCYIDELYKWKAVVQLCKKGYPVRDNMSMFIDMNYEDIYKKYECQLNDIFVNVDNKQKSYDICDGIYELIDKLDDGLVVGLSYNAMPLLTQETGGQCKGNITLVGGVSNVGKSSFVRTTTLPSIMQKKEKIVIMLNEEGLEKYQRELLVWIANNILNIDLQKHTVRDGGYSIETKDALIKSAQWLEEQSKNHMITVIPFQQYNTAKAIKNIKKYANMGVKYFLLDTFKDGVANFCALENASRKFSSNLPKSLVCADSTIASITLLDANPSNASLSEISFL